MYILLYTSDNESLKYFNLNYLGEFTVIPYSQGIIIYGSQ